MPLCFLGCSEKDVRFREDAFSRLEDGGEKLCILRQLTIVRDRSNYLRCEEGANRPSAQLYALLLNYVRRFLLQSVQDQGTFVIQDVKD